MYFAFKGYVLWVDDSELTAFFTSPFKVLSLCSWPPSLTIRTERFSLL